MSSNLDELKKHPVVLDLYMRRIKLRKDGREYVGICPFHGEKTASFKVYPLGGHYQYKCFGCNRTGNIFQFIENFDKVSKKKSYEVVEQAAAKGFDTTKQAEQSFRNVGREEEKPAMVIPLEKFRPLELELVANPAARKWLESRGISLETAQALHLGYRKDVGKLAHGDLLEIADKGWVAFPCIENGVVTSIKYRSIVRKAFCKQSGMARGDETPLFNSGDIDPLEPVYLVEGEPDCAVLKQAGFRATSLQSSSTRPTVRNKEQLLSAEVVILAGDTDPVGADVMGKLWSEMGERTFLLKWPAGCKDANETFLKQCKGDVSVFRSLVEELTTAALAVPMPGVYSLQESMASSTRTNLAEHPERLRFPWKPVDKMVNILPGSVLLLFATQTGMGKTTWLMNALISEAQRGEVVLNYSAELDTDEYSNLVAAHVLKKDRNTLTHEDNIRASKMLGGAKFYIGRNPDLSTADEVLDLIESAARRFGANIVVLDHIHFVCRNEKDTIKAQENAMQRIKNIAVKYRLKFIVVGQPRKAKQDARGKEVHITDAKGSETVSSDADGVLSIHRGVAKVLDPANPPSEPYEPLTKVHLHKGRSQGTGAAYAELWFDGKLATFFEMTPESTEPVGTQKNLLDNRPPGA